MRVVSLLGLVLMVGVLSAAIFFVASSRGSLGLTSNATPSVTVSGVVSSKDRASCLKSYYVGCYTVSSGGKVFSLVESNGQVKLDALVGKRASLTGEVLKIKNRNVLMVTFVTTQ